MQEVKMYQTRDGKLFKTESGAERHTLKLDKELAIKNVMRVLDLSKEEIGEKLKEISPRVPIVKMLLTMREDWTKWELHHIKLINPGLFEKPKKVTLYVMKEREWGKEIERELFRETDELFTDSSLHCDDEYKAVSVVEVDEFLTKVYYDYKYDWEERILRKLQKGEKIDTDDLKALVFESEVVYEEEGDDRRWSKSVLSVVDLKGSLFAIDWDRGLTENQENEFYNQPYPVTLEKEEVIVKTIVTKIVPIVN